jgi:hypothetical protein
MADQVIIDFIGNDAPLNATAARVKDTTTEIAKNPVVVDTGPTISYWKTWTDESQKAYDESKKSEASYTDTVERETKKRNALRDAPDIRPIGAAAFKDYDKELGAIEARAASTKARLNDLATVRLNAGQVTPLTRELVNAEREVNSIRARIFEARSSLSPNLDRTVFRTIQADIATDTELLARYEARLASVLARQASGADTGGGGGAGHGGLISSSGRLQGVGQLFRATGLYQYGIDETTVNAAVQMARSLGIVGDKAKDAATATQTVAAATSAAAGASSAEAAAATTAAGAETEVATAATAAAAAESEAAIAAEAGAAATSLWSVSMATIAPLLAVGAAVALVLYNITRDMRSEEEHRLKIIEAEVKGTNDQLTYQKGITDELKKQRGDAANSRELDTLKAGFASQSSADLQQRRAELEQLTKYAPTGNFDPATGAFSKLSPEQLTRQKQLTQELIALDDELYKRQHTPDTSFSNLGNNTIKQQADDAAQLNKEATEARAKVDQLVKSNDALFTGLYEQANADNPFVKTMLANEDAARKFKDTASLLPPELQSIGYALIKSSGDLATYKLQLDTAFKALDERNLADKFRGPTKEELQRQLNSNIADFRRTSNSTNPDAFAYYQRQQADLANRSQQQIQDNLDAQFAIARGARTDQQRGEADARLAAAARGLDPNSLRSDQRRDLADLFDRQAARAENRQAEALDIQKNLLNIWKRIDESGLKLKDRVNAEGKGALNIVLTDATSDRKVTRATAATEADSNVDFNLDIVGGSNY